jgi:hypothetical protein
MRESQAGSVYVRIRRIRVINLKGTTVAFDGFRSTLTIKNREGNYRA